jgi:hypothetical protein
VLFRALGEFKINIKRGGFGGPPNVQDLRGGGTFVLGCRWTNLSQQGDCTQGVSSKQLLDILNAGISMADMRANVQFATALRLREDFLSEFEVTDWCPAAPGSAKTNERKCRNVPVVEQWP